jgi:acyl-coenzyme A thioesterase PaaI-like protein
MALDAKALVNLWDRLHRFPGGAWLFSRILGFAIPYTGSIGARVRVLRPGYAQIALRDRRRVRNHLASVHAIALANLGELTGGLALTATASAGVRSILTRLEIDYLRKARGVVLAECSCVIPTVTEPGDHIIITTLHDESGNEVARTRATWRLSPVPNTKPRAY